MTYEDGFEKGERQSAQDRKRGVRQRFYGEPETPAEQGYRDGYTPRNPAWWQPVRERVAA